MALSGTKFNELSLGQYGSVYTTASSDAIKPPTNHIFAAITFLSDTVFDSSAGLVAETATKFVNTETAANDLADGIFIGPSETFCARLPNVTVANLHAISSDIADAGDASATAIVCALLDDVG